MELPNISLHFLVRELQPVLANAFVSRIQPIGENRLKFKLSTKQGSKELVLLPTFLYVSDYKIPSSSGHANFVQLLRKHLQGKKIRGIRQKGWDRVAILEFENADLVFELFASGNIVLVDKERKTIGCLHNEEWKDRATRRNKPYQFPASKPVPADFSAKQFGEILKKNPKKIVSALVAEFNLFPLLAEEAVLSIGVPRETLANELSAKKAAELHRAFSDFFAEKPPKPVLIKKQDFQVLLPFSFPNWLKEQNASLEPVSSLNTALDTVLSPSLSVPSKQESTEQSKRLQKLLVSLEEQKKALQKLEKQAVENQQKGEWIYAAYPALEEIKKALEKAGQKGYSKEQILGILQQSDLKGFEIAKKVVELDPRKKTVAFEFSA